MDVTPGLRRDPLPDLDAVGQDDELVDRMRAEIERDGPLSFARFMDLALYDPHGGYYRAVAARPGREGDFLTAPEAHPIFGAALARAVADVWDRLDRPEPFVLREYGAGTGALAVAILDGLARERADVASVLRYDPIEVEAGRLETIAARLAAAGHASAFDPTRPTVERADHRHGPRQRGPRRPADPSRRHASWRPARDRRRLGGRRLRRRRDRPVDAGLGRTSRRRRASSSATASVPRSASPSTPGSPTRPPASTRGVVLLIDYGYPADALYDPVRRRDGTLRAYLRHRVHDDPYVHVGRQDLTAHVDVTAVERAAATAGLTHLGTTTQAELLVGLGTEDLLRSIQADPATTLEGYLEVRSALLRLLDPAAMGRFRVMAFGRDWPSEASLAGMDYRLRPGPQADPT